ncbi:MAG: histidinol dehydrogenase [Chitinophagaceae bacterium]
MIPVFIQPDKSTWGTLLMRPALEHAELTTKVQEIMEAVRAQGEEAVINYTEQFDQVKLTSVRVTADQIKAAADELTPALKTAMQIAKTNIEVFHQTQWQKTKKVETMPGVWCWRKSVGIDKVGIYIPGGTAPLFSTVLMLGVPAQLAGCKEVILCTPPNAEGNINPAILYAASLVGIEKIFCIGGVQAIAAMTYGTSSVPKVYKIFGPGNQYVTAAKQFAQQQGIAIDMPAGPSEVCVYADDTCEPSFVAADLLSQAEHGVDSQVLLVASNEELVKKIQKEIDQKLSHLPRKKMAEEALKNSKAIVINTPEIALELINEYAPEHLILAIDKAAWWAEKITNAGSVFIGNYSPESVGDYASGTNHTLPTNGYAKAYSGVSVDSFVKKITFQQLTANGLQLLGPTVIEMAEAENLQAHSNAVAVRLQSLKK